MVKLNFIIFISVVFIIMGFSGCSSSEVNVNARNNISLSEEEKTSLPKESIDSSSVSDTSSNLGSMSVYERYKRVEAENACNLMKAGTSENSEDVLNSMAEYPKILVKYGISESEAQALVAQYKDNEQFKQETFFIMKEMCPEFVEKALEN